MEFRKKKSQNKKTYNQGPGNLLKHFPDLYFNQVMASKNRTTYMEREMTGKEEVDM